MWPLQIMSQVMGTMKYEASEAVTSNVLFGVSKNVEGSNDTYLDTFKIPRYLFTIQYFRVAKWPKWFQISFTYINLLKILTHRMECKKFEGAERGEKTAIFKMFSNSLCRW